MHSRRAFLGGFGGGLVAAGCAGAGAVRHAAAEPDDPEVTPAEDLMREHGVLEGVPLIHEEGVRRVDAGEPLAPAPIAQAAAIVRRFVEDYHEQLEEQHLFPRFEKAGVLADLVVTLRAQHEAGRALTAAIAARATAAGLADPAARGELVAAV